MAPQLGTSRIVHSRARVQVTLVVLSLFALALYTLPSFPLLYDYPEQPILLPPSKILVQHLTAPAVTIGRTTYIGAYYPELAQDFFGAIPYAAPPTGALRFAPPAPIEPHILPRTSAAMAYGPACLQNPGPNHLRETMDEDCLSLNVHRPAGLPQDAGLPVILFLHGGGFHAGSSAGYNATDIVARSLDTEAPLLFVTVNYRLGPWGFPGAGPALNLGLRDQQAALGWVHDHIAAFGGDPARITLMGQSAGAISASLLLLNSDSAPLIARSILHSGSPDTLRVLPPAARLPNWAAFAAHAGCGPAAAAAAAAADNDELACLRAASIDALIEAHGRVLANPPADLGSFGAFPWAPALDGSVVRASPRAMLAAGALGNMSVLTGTCMDEGTLFTPHGLASESALTDLLARSLAPEHGNSSASLGTKLTALYADKALRSPYALRGRALPAEYGPAYTRGAAVLGDLWFGAPRAALLRAAKAGKAWSWELRELAFVGRRSAQGVYHGLDLFYMFGGAGRASDEGGVHRLVRDWHDYWIAFATHGDPNVGGGERPTWPAWTHDAPTVLQLRAGRTRAVTDSARAEQIDFLMEVI